MKHKLLTSCVSLASGFAALAMATLPSVAQTLPVTGITPPAMQLSDGTNGVTIDSTLNVVYSGACSATLCPGTASTSGPGTIIWSGTIGVAGSATLPLEFSITGAEGKSNVALGGPGIDLGIGGVSASTAATLIASYTVTNLMVTGPVGLSTQTANGLSTYTAYLDPTNTVFGEASTAQVGQLTITAAQLAAGGAVSPCNAITGTSTCTAVSNANNASMTVVASTPMTAGLSYSSDFGFIASTISTTTVSSPGATPSISLTKSASLTTVNPFQKVTYTYVVTNTGTVPLTNVKVVDDNGTPSYTADDFTVGTIASLAAGASQTLTATVYPPVTEIANDITEGDGGNMRGWGTSSNWSSQFNYNSNHPGGILICQQQSNGDMKFTFLVDKSITDNTYGKGSSAGWGYHGNSFSNFANDGAEFKVYDGQGNCVLDFVADYVSSGSGYPSGYGSAGIKGGGKLIFSGNSSWVKSVDTTITDSLNQNRAFNTCIHDSPSSNPDWQKQSGYTVQVSSSSWGNNGFGAVGCPLVSHHSESQNCKQHQCEPTSSTVINTATATGNYGTTTVTATAQATVYIAANQCNWGWIGKI